MRGKTITQVKMLHDSHPVADLLGQISWSNAGSKSLVKFVGQNRWSNLSVEFVGRIHGSNLPVKLLVVTCDVTDVTPDVTSNARNQTQPIFDPPLASLGARMDAPTDGPKTAQDRPQMGKEKGHAVGRGLGSVVYAHSASQYAWNVARPFK